MMKELTIKEMNRELLRYAVSRAMFCHCGSILDVRRAVLASYEYDGQQVGQPFLMCGRCWDDGNSNRFYNALTNVKRRIKEGEAPGKDPDLYRSEVIDGREF
jgi:hypothetical protein